MVITHRAVPIGGLTKKHLEKATATEPLVASGYTFYAGDRELKTGTATTRELESSLEEIVLLDGHDVKNTTTSTWTNHWQPTNDSGTKINVVELSLPIWEYVDDEYGKGLAITERGMVRILDFTNIKQVKVKMRCLEDEITDTIKENCGLHIHNYGGTAMAHTQRIAEANVESNEAKEYTLDTSNLWGVHALRLASLSKIKVVFYKVTLVTDNLSEKVSLMENGVPNAEYISEATIRTCDEANTGSYITSDNLYKISTSANKDNYCHTFNNSINLTGYSRAKVTIKGIIGTNIILGFTPTLWTPAKTSMDINQTGFEAGHFWYGSVDEDPNIPNVRWYNAKNPNDFYIREINTDNTWEHTLTLDISGLENNHYFATHIYNGTGDVAYVNYKNIELIKKDEQNLNY